MIEIKPDAVYERGELVAAFPDLSRQALTRTLLAWGGKRPYAGSRKVFIRGDAILKALAPTDSETEAPRVASPSRRDQGPFIERMKAW